MRPPLRSRPRGGQAGGRGAAQQHLETSGPRVTGERRRPRSRHRAARRRARRGRPRQGPATLVIAAAESRRDARAADTRPAVGRSRRRTPAGGAAARRCGSRPDAAAAASSAPVRTARTTAARATAGSGGISTRSAPATSDRTAGAGPRADRRRRHLQRVGDHEPTEAELVTQQSVDHLARQRRGHAGVDGADVEVTDHHRRQPLPRRPPRTARGRPRAAHAATASARAGSRGCRRAPTRDRGSA